MFAAGDKVDVTGTSKGKGYAGVIKRWNFQRLKESHGSGPVARHGGSIGSCSDPPECTPASKMPAIWEARRVTVQNLQVVKDGTPRTTLSLSRARFRVLTAVTVVIHDTV